LRQGLVHLLAAFAAGAALDRGGLRALLLGAGGSFAIALPGLGAGEAAAALAAPLYAGGISAYSAALVAAPSLAGAAMPGRAAVRAAWLYGLAGWLGSGVGVGAARHLAWPAIAGSALAVLGGVAALLAPSARGRAREAAIALALGACGGFVALRSPVPAEDPVARGRLVYLAEGCQHCHSQYVRPVAQDALWWGPRRELDRRERPPTPGNRRIGPDLANVGLRRAALWQERHLRDPRALSPGSSMPSYAHLFAAGDRRGPDLVAYLGSLGAGAEGARLAAIRRAPMAAAPQAPSASRGARLFARHCAPCHGQGGRGEGGALGELAVSGLDLGDGALRRARDYGVDEPLERAVARVIRFGLPPWLMPGHEWLGEQEVADLADFVLQLSESGAVRVAAR
jgi:cytochrome c oxidase cbb3-type subunit 2